MKKLPFFSFKNNPFRVVHLTFMLIFGPSFRACWLIVALEALEVGHV